MEKKIFIIRHGKSDWSSPDMPDIDRPLKSRGVRDGYKMAELLKQRKEKIDLVISSPATRAIHTALIFTRILQISEKNIKVEPDFYMAESKLMNKYCQKVSDNYNNIMIVGHNPGITTLTNDYFPKEVDNVPTSGVVILNFTCKSWSKISTDTLKGHFFDYPKRHRILK